VCLRAKDARARAQGIMPYALLILSGDRSPHQFGRRLLRHPESKRGNCRMTKNDKSIDGPALPVVFRGGRGVLLTCSLLGLLGGCVSDGGTRVASEDAPDARQVADAQAAEPSRPAASEDVQVDAEAAVETAPRRQAAGSYVVFGKRYYIEASSSGHFEKGLASWYGRKFHGRPTSSGERYDMYQLTAAHKSLPLPTYAQVTNLANGRSVLVKVNDRGPFVEDRVIDLSYAAAQKLEMIHSGVAMVEVRAVDSLEAADEGAVLLAGGAAAEGAMANAAPTGEAAGAEAVGADAQPQQLASAVAGATDAKPTAGTEGKLFVQAGQFGNRNSAEGLRRRLLDHLAEQVQVRVGDDPLSRYEVAIGPLASPAQAEDISKQLVALGVTEPATRVE
jgi:rare lipoprotein A